jgi:hypothetical protein
MLAIGGYEFRPSPRATGVAGIERQRNPEQSLPSHNALSHIPYYR